jgi:hypothetical protein
MKILRWWFGAFLVMTSSLAIAAQGSYFYGAFDIGRERAGDLCTGLPAGVACKDNDRSFRLSTGYQAIAGIGEEAYGIEGSYVHSGKLSVSGFGVAAETKNTEWQISAVGTIPWGDRFTTLGKIGLAFWSLNTKSSPTVSGLSPSGIDILVGAGAQLEISKKLAIRCMFDSHMIGDSVTGRGHLNTLNIGAIMRF